MGDSNVRLRMYPAWVCLFLLTVMVTKVGAAEDLSAIAKDARLGGDLTRTRFVADLSDAVDFRAFVLADPYRVIIDLPEVKFLMPSGSGAQGKGLVSAFRYGQFAPGKSRIVIDTVQPVLIDKAFVRPAENGQPARLVVDLVRASREDFERQRQNQNTMQQPVQEPRKSAPGKAAHDAPGQRSKPLIVLDPGHGGVDPGATSINGNYEKNIVFTFCQTLKAKLEASGRYHVIMTREEDVFISLSDRMEHARKEQADLLLSVHADAMKHVGHFSEIRGASIYTLSEEASDDLAKEVAASENKADILAGAELEGETDDDLAGILIDLMHRETKNLSVTYAKQLLTNLKGKVELTQNPHRFANFRVLKAQDIPSILLELGYLSQKQDEKALMSDEWRSKTADAIVASLDTFFAKRQVSLPPR
jgi:N-acetylmuramoyl-L-alanine amidase